MTKKLSIVEFMPCPMCAIKHHKGARFYTCYNKECNVVLYLKDRVILFYK